MPMASY